MSKTLKYIIAIVFMLAVGASLTNAQMGGGISVPSFFKKVGNSILPQNTSWTLGDSTNRWAEGWFTSLNATSITIAGTSVGDLNMGGHQITNAATTTASVFVAASSSATSTFQGALQLGSGNGPVMAVDANDSNTFKVAPGLSLASPYISITTAGNVGIATSTPTYPLDVWGFINVGKHFGYKQDGNTILYATSTNFSIYGGINAGIGSIANATSSDNTSNPYSTGFGYNALRNSTTTNAGLSGSNTAFGYNALAGNSSNSPFSYNTGMGTNVLKSLTSGGYYNTGMGDGAMTAVTSGDSNTCMGFNCLLGLTTGVNNVAFGTNAGIKNQTGNGNTSIGRGSGGGGGSSANSHSNGTYLGLRAGGQVTTGLGNIIIGANTASTTALTTGAQNILIGYDILPVGTNPSNTLNIGNLIFGTALDGQGTNLSTGSIGIGTTSPATTLVVQGYTQSVIASGVATSTCTTAIEGAQVYNLGNHHLWLCQGTEPWVLLK